MSPLAVVNCLVNNLTNLCILLAIPALIWGLNVRAQSKKKADRLNAHLHRLSLSLTLVAMIFFSLVVWALGRDGTIDRNDGIALVGLFFFWQCFHVYEVLKENARRGDSWSGAIVFDVVLILAGSFVTLVSVEGIVGWVLERETGILRTQHLGVFTGFLMVLPNAVLAFYYAAKRRPDVTYTSQVGDAHICIPLCIGLFALFQPMPIAPLVAQALLVAAAAAFVHLLCVAFFGRLPKPVALVLIAAFATLALRWPIG